MEKGEGQGEKTLISLDRRSTRSTHWEKGTQKEQDRASEETEEKLCFAITQQENGQITREQAKFKFLLNQIKRKTEIGWAWDGNTRIPELYLLHADKNCRAEL